VVCSAPGVTEELHHFLEELKRRRVFRALLGYGVVAFGLLQLAEPVMHGLGLPETSLRLLVVTLAAGFPVTVALAWIFDVKAGKVERTAEATLAEGSARTPLGGLRLALLLVGLGLAAASPGVVYFFGPWSARPAPVPAPSAEPRATAPAAPPSVAVLPFADMSPAKDQEYFADGIAEEILNTLAHLPGLRVAGRTSSFSFKGKNEDLAAIAQKLKVGAVLEGSVRKDGSRLRITAQLINAADGYHLWSETFDRELTNVFAVQEEIARRVGEALKVSLLHAPAPGQPEARRANPEAYTQYLLGQQLGRLGTKDGVERAHRAFQAAVALDPAFPEARARLAGSYWALLTVGVPRNLAEVEEVQRRGMEEAERAVALGPELPDGYRVRGLLRQDSRFDWAGAQADLERALRLGPGDAANLRAHADLLAALGRLGEAIEENRRATELDPLASGLWMSLGRMLLSADRLEEGRAAIRRGLEISPDSVWASFWAPAAELLAGRPELALPLFEKSSDDGLRLTGMALCLEQLGRRTEADQALAGLIAARAHDDAYQVAQVYAWRGDRDRAFEWLERSRRQRDGGLSWILHDPFLRSLRPDPRYRALVLALKLPLP
jgi:TolB-like protein/Flp pilus assembly protein TadD